MVKDLEAAHDYARSTGVPPAVTTAGAEAHHRPAAAGHGDAALMHYYRSTGVES
jgi:hypothetical protein